MSHLVRAAAAAVSVVAVNVASAPAAFASIPPSEPASDVSPSEAIAGLRVYLDSLRPVMFEDEGSLSAGACPLVTVDEIAPVLAGIGGVGAIDALPAQFEIYAQPEPGAEVAPVGVYCDFEFHSGSGSAIAASTVSVVDLAADPGATSDLNAAMEIVDSSPTPGSETLGGEHLNGCFDDTQCVTVWHNDELAVALIVEFTGPKDAAAVDVAHAAVLPTVLSALAAFAP